MIRETDWVVHTESLRVGQVVGSNDDEPFFMVCRWHKTDRPTPHWPRPMFTGVVRVTDLIRCDTESEAWAVSHHMRLMRSWQLTVTNLVLERFPQWFRVKRLRLGHELRKILVRK